MAKAITILVAGDVLYDIEETVRLASSPLHQIHQTKDNEYACTLFEEYQPQILILCFSRFELSEQFYINLLLSSDKAIEQVHQTIIMCDGKESKTAYELTQKGIIDDYVIYKPLFDVNRLRFVILRLQERSLFLDMHRVLLQRIEAIIESYEQLTPPPPVDQIKEVIGNHRKGLQEINIREKLSEYQIKQHQQNIEAIVANEKPKKLDDDAWLENIKTKGSGSYETKTEPESYGDSPTILIVEDEPINSQTMKLILNQDGYQTLKAENGLEAIKIAREKLPDMILMDIKMPKMNGLKAVCALKEKPETANIPIIMLSAHSENAVVRECLKQGACDYIIKPAERNILLERIAFHLTHKL
jgi:CheY-like chemotaxis protein